MKGTLLTGRGPLQPVQVIAHIRARVFMGVTVLSDREMTQVDAMRLVRDLRTENPSRVFTLEMREVR